MLKRTLVLMALRSHPIPAASTVNSTNSSYSINSDAVNVLRESINRSAASLNFRMDKKCRAR